jgi:hypothetical protein
MPSGCCPISSATRLEAAGLVVLRRPASLGQHQFNESVAVGLDDLLESLTAEVAAYRLEVVSVALQRHAPNAAPSV